MSIWFNPSRPVGSEIFANESIVGNQSVIWTRLLVLPIGSARCVLLAKVENIISRGENFDFWRTFRFLDKISIFCWKFRFLSKILIFDESFDFWPKFRYLTKIPILDENFDFWPKFRFLIKMPIIANFKYYFQHDFQLCYIQKLAIKFRLRPGQICLLCTGSYMLLLMCRHCQIGK